VSRVVTVVPEWRPSRFVYHIYVKYIHSVTVSKLLFFILKIQSRLDIFINADSAALGY